MNKVNGHRGTSHIFPSRNRVTTGIDDAKRRLRGQARQVRAAAASATPDAARAISVRLLAALEEGLIDLGSGAAVSAYWPKGDELDPRPIMIVLAERGHRIGLPVVPGPARPLVFREWAPGDTLVSAGFGLEEPAAERREVVPEFLLVPLLAFDRRGYRLGYGGGFYDRSLAALQTRGPATAVGLAYSRQELAEVPCGPNDRPLDWVVTETETIATAGETGRAAAILR